MRTRYGLSPWIERVPRAKRPDFPRLGGELSTPVAIIGGGLVGCATAYAAAAAGLTPILIESARIGQGSSGYGAGLLLPTPGPSFRDVAAAHGLRIARRMFETWQQTSVEAAAQIKRLGIRAGVAPHDTLLVSSLEAALRKDYTAREEAGLGVQWLAPKAVTLATGLETAGGIRAKGGFSLDPYATCIGLVNAATKRRATIFEKTTISKIQVTPGSVDIVCASGVVRAQRVVIATGTPTAAFKPLLRHFTAKEGYLALTEPVPDVLRKQFGRRDAIVEDSHLPRHRLLWTPDNRILITGADQAVTSPRMRDAVLVQRTGQLMYELLMMHTSIAGLRPEHGWSVPYAETADGLPFIGAHRNYPRHLFALGGGDSATGAFLAAAILGRALRGIAEKRDDDFGWAPRRLS